MENPLARDLEHVLAHTESLWDELRGERIFLTGGTGFVGTWLTESLAWANRRLSLGISAVLLTRDPGAFSARAPHLANDPAITLWRGDATTFDLPPGSFPFLIHAATEAHGPAAFDRDLAATRRVLDLARGRKTRRLLFTSSGAVYGKQPPDLKNVPEDYPGAPFPTDTASGYGQAKRVSEYLSCCAGQDSGFDAVIARLFAFVGPLLPLDANFAVGNFIRDALGGGPISIAGDGTPYRSYLYAADLAIWIWTLLLRGRNAVPYNVGSPHEISIAALARCVASVVPAAAGITIAKEAIPGALALRYVPAVDRAAALGLQSWIPLDEGIRRTCEWHRARR
jgi:dTDP-glucose 4,6-dehydratase